MENCNAQTLIRTSLPRITAVIGILRNTDNQVLIACRPPSVVQSGFWEFPGGKVEPNESLEVALCREFQEEVGVRPIEVVPFLSFDHQTDTHHLYLHSYEIVTYEGTPYGREQQEIRWVNIENLSEYTFLKANLRMIALLRSQFHEST